MPSQETTTALAIGGIGVAATVAMGWKLLGGSNKPEPSPDKTVLVIGGGLAGLSTIYGLRQIDSQVKIILVEPKEYCETLWAAYRSPFEEWVAKGSLSKLELYCKEYNVQHIQSTATKLTNDGIATLSNGDTITFDVCTVATGADSHWPGMGRGLPASAEAATARHRLAAMAAEGERLLNAKSVVIIGGGLIGTELAGDIAGYSSKANKTTPKITLIHSAAQLCPIMSPSAGNAVQKMLEDLGVTVILNEKAKVNDGGGGKTKVILQSSKKEIDADVTVVTIGFKPINSFMKEAFPESLDEKGWIVTDEHLCVPGSSGKVFAFGDCSSTLPNAANVYMRLAATLGHNIKTSLSNQEEDMKKFELPFAGYCNTVGPDQGVFYSSAFWTKRLLPWVKNKTMFFMSPRDMIGLKKEYSLAN